MMMTDEIYKMINESQHQIAEIAKVSEIDGNKAKVIRPGQDNQTKHLMMLDGLSLSVDDRVLLLRLGKSINSSIIIGKLQN